MLLHPTPTSWILPDVGAIRTGVATAWLVRRGDAVVAIDTGVDPRRYRTGLERLGVDAARVRHAFLTHSDYDHVGGVPVLRDATLHVGRTEDVMLRGERPRMLWHRNSPLPRDPVWMDDGQTIDVGPLRVQALHLPGHTPGSTAYLVDGRYLFTGDAVSLSGGRARVSPWFMFMDPATARRSLERVRPLTGIDLLATAHYGHTLDFARAVAL